MTELSQKIFRAYDVRGTVAGPNINLTAGIMTDIGRAYGSHLHTEKLGTTVVVGQDTRPSSASLAAAFIEGLLATGCDVIDLGPCPTPVSYWYATRQGNLPRAMITGSHLEASKNGVKFSIGNRPLYGDTIQAFYQRIQNQDFVQASTPGTRTTHDAKADYIADIQQDITLEHPPRVVLECYRGATALIARELFTALGCEIVECLNCSVSDGTFSTHQPNPSEAENLRELIAAVQHHNAELGIAFDGDGDRVGIVDNNGTIIDADRLLALLARDLLSRQPGAVVVVDVSGSSVVTNEVRRLGGTPIMCRNGHPFIKVAMDKHAAALGGEVSGHIFIDDNYYGFDDGLYAAVRLVEAIANAGKPLSEIDASIPRLYSTPVYRPHCPPEQMPDAIAAVKAELSAQAQTVTEIDGLRLDFDNGWGLIRASNTEPVLSMRFEGNTETDATQHRDAFFAVLATFPDIDLSKYRD